MSCWILEKKRRNHQIFTFSKQSFLKIFDLGQKNTPKLHKLLKKNCPNHKIALLSFTIPEKNPLFDIDLFSRFFNMELLFNLFLYF